MYLLSLIMEDRRVVLHPQSQVKGVTNGSSQDWVGGKEAERDGKRGKSTVQKWVMYTPQIMDPSGPSCY